MSTGEGTRTGRASVTMKDVAERAGVSLMTVSRVLNDTATVKPDTRERVERAVKALNYRPNLGARRLAGGRSMFVGLLYHNPSPGYLSKILKGGLNACRVYGHHLVLEDFSTSAPYRNPELSVRALNLGDLDGLIVTPPLSVHQPFMDVLKAASLPVVSIAPADIDEPGLSVAMDDAQAVEDMVAFLVGTGHRRIAFVRGPDNHAASHHRLAGFLRGMDAHGLPVPDGMMRDGDFTYRSGLVSGQSLLDMDVRPTAIVACNDDMAAGVIGAAHMLGLSVPRDVSVSGFDDIELATTIFPELTTVRQPISAMANQAVGLLTAHLRGDAKGLATHGRRLPHEIMVRGSVSAPPNA